MHVAIVSPYDPRPESEDDPLAVHGGVEQSLDRTAAALAARGHVVTLVASSDRDSVRVCDDGVRLVRVRRRATVFRNPIAPLGRAIPVDADVVHVPATYPFHSDLIPWRETRRGRAVVLDYHFDVHGTSVAMEAAAVVHRWTLGRLMHRATRVVTKSLDYAAHSRVLSRLPRASLDWVPNGVDLRELRLGSGGRQDILCVGRLVPYKGVGTLLRAMPAIHAQTGARLLVVGDGPDRARLERLAAELRAPADFLGRVSRERLVGLYAGAGLTVLPSANSQEAFGITLLESMACGTPVVASDLPGVREIARLGGATCPPNDPAALAAAVVDALREPKRFGSPSELRSRVARDYAWSAIARRLESVYDAALDDAALARARRAPLLRDVPGGSS